MKIDTKDRKLQEVLESGYFRIPRFQRPYSWDRANVEEFWHDTVGREDADYFIGSIVVFRDKSDGSFCLVDGQQRLTTLTMLLCALRNAFRAAGETNLANGVHTLVERRDVTNKLRFVLSSETAYPYLQEHIQREGPAELPPAGGAEEQDLAEAYGFIAGQLADAVDTVRHDPAIADGRRQQEVKHELEKIRDKLLGLSVIFVEIDNEDDAYLVFETLNTRGKDLTVSDLVKNHITRLKRPRNEGVDVAKHKWNSILGSFDESEADLRMSAFLLHLWLSRYRFVSQRDLFKEIRKEVTDRNVDEFLDTLVHEARVYRIVHEPGYRSEGWRSSERQIRRSLEALQLFRVRQSVPMVLSVMTEWLRGELKLKTAKKMLRALEAFHFVFNAVTSQRSSGGVSMMFASHARQLREKSKLDKPKVCDELMAKLRERLPTWEEFEANFLEIRVTEQRTKQRALVRYILQELAEAGKVQLDMASMTVEHILPQGGAGGQQPDEVVGQVGNLLLVRGDVNSQLLRDRPWPEKKRILVENSVWMDDYLRNAESWDSDGVGARTKAMARRAYESVWKV